MGGGEEGGGGLTYHRQILLNGIFDVQTDRRTDRQTDRETVGSKVEAGLTCQR